MEEKETTAAEEQEQTRFTRFLDRLRVFPRVPKFPIRTWVAWLGVAFFIAMVIAYYVTNGG